DGDRPRRPRVDRRSIPAAPALPGRDLPRPDRHHLLDDRIHRRVGAPRRPPDRCGPGPGRRRPAPDQPRHDRHAEEGSGHRGRGALAGPSLRAAGQLAVAPKRGRPEESDREALLGSALERGIRFARGHAWALALAAAILLATGLRLHGLTRHPIWLDEAYSVAVARQPLRAIAPSLADETGPPLYYLLHHAWIRLYGEGKALLRLFSM